MKKLVIKGTKRNSWLQKEVAAERAAYEAEINDGAIDKGYLWASLYLEIFLEGVFTLKPVPNVVEVNVPNGVFRLTALQKEGEMKWLIRNDAFGCIEEVNPNSLFEWAVENYPDGISIEGYHILAHRLLTIGCKDEEEKKKVWDYTFYYERDTEEVTCDTASA